MHVVLGLVCSLIEEQCANYIIMICIATDTQGDRVQVVFPVANRVTMILSRTLVRNIIIHLTCCTRQANISTNAQLLHHDVMIKCITRKPVRYANGLPVRGLRNARVHTAVIDNSESIVNKWLL